jgi:hypothetical protein
MKLNVWLSADAKTPFEFEVQGVAVEAGKTQAIKPVDSHGIPLGLRATEIARVEQVFDLRTAPIKRIEYLALGKAGERQHKEPLVMSKFSEADVEKENPKEDAKTVSGIERRRYLKVSEQIRQMPLGVVVVADQAYMKDLLEEVGRSKLRIQIAQTEWSRFHGTLNFAVPAQPKGPIGPGPAPKADGPANNHEDPNAPGLVEVSIYGIASLYEKYPADKPVPKADPDGKGEGEGDKKPTAQRDQNWLRLHELINRSLPMPGPDGNMLTPEQRKLWDFAAGKLDGRRATEKYFARQKLGVDPRMAFADDDMRDCLATLDIEAVHARYTTNLKGLYDNAADYQKKYVNGQIQEVFEIFDEPVRKPEGEGWVFEIRGTTWFDVGTVQGRDFVTHTLIANLNKQAKDPRLPADLKDRIGHILFYNVWRDPNPRPDTFHFIHASLIDNLMPAEGGVPMGGVEGVPYQSTGVRPNEVGPKAPNAKSAAKARARYEFVILFVWKEPPASAPVVKDGAEIGKPWAPFFDPIGPPDTGRNRGRK